jgi:hypothetical protein
MNLFCHIRAQNPLRPEVSAQYGAAEARPRSLEIHKRSLAIDRKLIGIVFAAAAAVAALYPAAGQAASAQAHGAFQVSIGHDRMVEWYEAHRAEVFQAANCRILEELAGGEYLAQTNTPGGVCRYVIKETRQQGTTKEGQPTTTFRVTYVRNVSGRLANFELVIAMTGRSDRQTQIDLRMMADVAGRFVPVRAVSSVLEGSKSGSTNYILKNAR